MSFMSFFKWLFGSTPQVKNSPLPGQKWRVEGIGIVLIKNSTLHQVSYLLGSTEHTVFEDKFLQSATLIPLPEK